MYKTYTLSVTENTEGEAIIEFPEEVMEKSGWNEGDTIQWANNLDGSWTLTKVENKVETEWVMVECIGTFRQRYMVQVPQGKTEWALDTVTMEDAKEFSQLHLGETIVSHRVVTEEEALATCDEDNSYCIDWTDEKKMEVFFTPHPLNEICNDN
jgi:hypothetical protein